MAQKDCSDAVHPTNYRASILNCCIKDIKEGNIVVYAKDGVINEIEAVAVNLNKAYYALKEPNDSIRNRVLLNNNPEAHYDDHPHEYHQYLYKKAQNKQTMGIALCVVGGGLLIGGSAIIDQKARKYNYFDPDDENVKVVQTEAIPINIVGAKSSLLPTMTNQEVDYMIEALNDIVENINNYKEN